MAPVILAVYLLSAVPFALLIPVDLVDAARQPGIFPDAPHDDIAKKLEGASQLLMLRSQMTWVLGNLPERIPTEIFALQLRTPAPITGYHTPAPGVAGNLADESDEAEGTLPRTLEAWIRAQKGDETFDELLEGMPDKALKDELWINAPDGHSPTIIVPKSCQEMLVRDTHQRMHHLAHAKVYAFMRRI